MLAPPLSIRNLTSTTIELKVIERYEHAGHGTSANKSNISSIFTNLLNATPTAPQLANHSESFTHEEVSIPISPYETKKTEIEASNGEVLRLTFETQGQRYRLDTPISSSKSTVLTPLSPNPRFEYTAVYIPKFSHLSIFSSAKLDSWMSMLKDASPLSALSIPGTHNSPTCYLALPSVRCQVVGIKEQLYNGVRFFDIRVQPENPMDPLNDRLILVHSAFPVSLTGNKYFRDVEREFTAFLDQNPSETIIVSLKREGVGRATDQQLSKILFNHYTTATESRWFTENRIPTLGETRNRIILMRRFVLDDSLKGEHRGAGWGIDGSSWPDNCEDGICSSGLIRVQDFYKVNETVNIGKKIRYCQAHLERAAKCVCVLPGDPRAAAARNPFYMNFLSASNFFQPGCWPDRIAAKVNPAIIDYLCRRHNEPEGMGGPDGEGARVEIGDGSTGIVVCDWVGNNGDWDLVRCILGHNAKLEMREKSMVI